MAYERLRKYLNTLNHPDEVKAFCELDIFDAEVKYIDHDDFCVVKYGDTYLRAEWYKDSYSDLVFSAWETCRASEKTVIEFL